MPPPRSAGNTVPVTKPLVMVRPERLTTVFGPMWNTRLRVSPSTVSPAGPGPSRATLLLTNSSPLVSRMVPETPVASMVSPSAAAASAARNVPGPLSAVLVTVIVPASAAWRASSAGSSRVANLFMSVFVDGLILQSFGQVERRRPAFRRLATCSPNPRVWFSQLGSRTTR